MAKKVETVDAAQKPDNDALEEMRKRIKRLALLQGIPITNIISNASEHELKELEELVANVALASENSDFILQNLDKLKSLKLKGVSFNSINDSKEMVKDSADLFDKYVISALTKSYDNLKKIKGDKNCTNYDFFKGCIRFAAYTFFAIKTFYGKVRAKHPILMAVELVFAKYIAPIYAVVEIISGVLSACGLKDRTAELVVGGIEMREETKKAEGLKKEIEKEQGNVSIKDFAQSCDKLQKTEIFDEAVKISSGAEEFVSLATKFEEVSGVAKEQAIDFIKKTSSLASDLPKSKNEIKKFIDNVLPKAHIITENQSSAVDNLKAKLCEIKDGIPMSERLTSMSLHLKKFTKNFVKEGGEIPALLKNFISKIGEVHSTISQKSSGKVAKALGYGMGFSKAAESLVNIIKPINTKKSMG